MGRVRAALLASTALVALSLVPTSAHAVDVSNAAELQAAILALNAGGADHTINVTQSIVLDPGAANQLTAITQAVDITGAGPGISITGTGAVAGGHGIFFIAAGAGNAVNISNLTLSNGFARGGDAANGAGGGARRGRRHLRDVGGHHAHECRIFGQSGARRQWRRGRWSGRGRRRT